MSSLSPSTSANRQGMNAGSNHPGNVLRSGVAECIGTFFLVYTGTATAAAGALGKATAGSPPDSLAVALAFGLVLAALVGALGQVSGAHLNGAVTLGLAVSGKFPWRYVPSYLVFQLLGAVLGAGATWATFGNRARDVAHLGATVPADGVSDGQAFVVEALITFLLVFVIMAVATDARVPAALAAPSIGFALVAPSSSAGESPAAPSTPTGPSAPRSCPAPSPRSRCTWPPRSSAASPPRCCTPTWWPPAHPPPTTSTRKAHRPGRRPRPGHRPGHQRHPGTHLRNPGRTPRTDARNARVVVRALVADPGVRMADEHTRECLGGLVDHSITGWRRSCPVARRWSRIKVTG